MPRKNWTPETDAYIDRRIGEGATYAVIGREFGVTAAAIAGRLDRRRRLAAAAGGERVAVGALRTLEQNLGYERAMQGGCRWVIGEPPGVWHWCGNPIVAGPYCAEHVAQSKNTRGGESKR